tara:strand:+ start:763 stop:912 length:150 start_codon:yes stop_codon:yes gene_type:complete
MLKKILSILKKIKCKLSCCYESQCSLNENILDPNNIDEVIADSEKFKPK